ncbi:ABC transporter ATP-binding protein [Atopobium sp. oral taxon 810]|uniref:ABC transporter ATP-binding protein n=1 Tax=Atopobium sp. oral taxon 810 TaxID=712158 RepID=UPI000396FB12|nr:ABC transporter ATP-binding protein [Atopobium sp. oral taxon 810]ERI04591.1 putative O-antigen export system ATP-binding protein RfbB [Atopobium sp. oral taxon 810 str. F0209]
MSSRPKTGAKLSVKARAMRAATTENERVSWAGEGEAKVIRDNDKNNPIAVRFSNVYKTYYLYKNDKQRLLGTFTNKIDHKVINATDNLSFTINRGDSLALLGLNGAGKSTALKMITGVCYPTRGTIEVHGRISALLELSAGFDGNLTGRENLEMRCQLWGFTRDETEALIPQMHEFSELGDYMEQPIRTYSSGMKARLGFAFASSINPDILVIDEALSVGDKRFRKKCEERVKDIMAKDNLTVLFVTHSPEQALQFCTRGIVLQHGSSVFEGDIEGACQYYDEH